jgi:hypothetical protein
MSSRAVTRALLGGLASALVAWSAASVRAEVLAEITVAERGLCAVSAWDLHRAGVDVEGIPIAQLGMTNRGQRVATEIDDLDGDGLFNGADRIVFFGQRLRDEGIYRYRYADFNVYLLERWSPGEAPPHQDRPAWLGPRRALDGDTPVSFQRRVHFEQDRYWSDLFEHRAPDKTDYSYWAVLSPLRDGGEQALTFDVPEVDRRSKAPFSLALMLMGRSSASRQRAQGITDHHLAVSLNGQELGQITFDGASNSRTVFDGLDASLLRPHGNELTVHLVTRPEVTVDVVYLDWFEVQFPSHPILVDDHGEFTLPGPSAGKTFEIGGLSSRDVHLFCLTDESVLAPAVASDNPSGPTTTHSLSFTAPCDDGLYAISTTGSLVRPQGIRPFAPHMPRDSTSGVDYLIVTHPDFRAAAERLAAHRREHDGLSPMVVDVNDLYDLFSDGVPHPDAIRDGLRHIFNTWPEPRLRYVLLLGDASWDWHGLSYPNPTFIPTHYYPSTEPDYSSDAYFAMVGDGEIPQFAIGRLPVKTPEEAEGAVDKLITYDRELDEGGSPGDWRHRIIFAASDNPLYKNFLDQAVANFVEGNFDLRRAYASDDSPLDCTQELIDTINEGCAFVSYVGHGARYVWQTGTTLARRARDYEANFNPDRVDELFNGSKLPIIFGITCFTNNFDNPNPRNCIGEKMVLSPTGGAVASFATSSYSYVHTDMVFCDILFQTLFEDHPERVGDLYLGAVQNSRAGVDVRRMFIVLGDPASTLPLVPLPRAAGPHHTRAGAASEEVSTSSVPVSAETSTAHEVSQEPGVMFRSSSD